MRRVHIFAWVFLLVTFSLASVAYSGTNTASDQDKSSGTPTKLRIEFEDNLITAIIAGASLKEVVQELAEVTEAKFVLMGDQRWAKQTIFTQVDKKPLEKAMARILLGYSYAVTPMAGSDMPKVIIVLDEVKGAQMKSSVAGDSLAQPRTSNTSAVAKDMTPDDKNALKANVALQAASVPSDLDEYMQLPEQELGEEGSEQSPDNDGLSTEEQAALEERRIKAQLERSISALDSEHPHLRAMAVEELVNTKDSRAVSALESFTKSADASDDERRQTAKALWYLAGDLGFADLGANAALRELAQSSDPTVQAIGAQALKDMERYLQRQRR